MANDIVTVEDAIAMMLEHEIEPLDSHSWPTLFGVMLEQILLLRQINEVQRKALENKATRDARTTD